MIGSKVMTMWILRVPELVVHLGNNLGRSWGSWSAPGWQFPIRTFWKTEVCQESCGFPLAGMSEYWKIGSNEYLNTFLKNVTCSTEYSNIQWFLSQIFKYSNICVLKFYLPKYDTWHVTQETWHVSHRNVNIVSKFQVPSSYGLRV